MTLTGTYPDFASFDYINYDDGSTGADFEHTYTEPGNDYAPTMYVYNTSYPSTTALCQSDGIYVAATYCGDGDIQNPNTSGQIEVCDDGANNGIVCDPSYGSSCNYCNNSCTISSIT